MEVMPFTYRTRLESILGMPRITQSEHVMKEQRAFPPSKNRSARIRKKLIKRYGYEVRMVPSAIKVGDDIIMHPKLYAEMVRKVQERIDQKAVDMLLRRTNQ